MKSPKNQNLTVIKLGDYIKKSTKNNKDMKYGEEFIVGVNNKSIFTDPKGNVSGVNLKPYKIVNKGDFVYNPSRLDLGSIAYRKDKVCIVSHLYQVFYLNEAGKKIINPDFLFMYFCRKEFYREVTFRNFGSQRPEFNLNDMSELKILLPDIQIQQKYVDIYNAMLINQQSYEHGLKDLKLVCDAYIEDLKKKINSEPIGAYIERLDLRNGLNGTKNVMGVSTSKEFREPTSKVNRNKLSNYKVVKPRQFSFVQTTHNEKVFAYSFNNTNENIVVTSVNEVFSVDEQKLLPEYLAMFFNRTEFDRYARFHSWGSARETFTWDDLIKVEIPIADITIQKAIADIYSVYKERKAINERLKIQIKDICPILIKGSIEEAKKLKEE